MAAVGASLVQAKVGDEFLLEMTKWPSEFVFDVDRGLELETADGSTFDIAVCDNKRRIANHMDVIVKVVEPGVTHPILRSVVITWKPAFDQPEGPPVEIPVESQEIMLDDLVRKFRMQKVRKSGPSAAHQVTKSHSATG